MKIKAWGVRGSHPRPYTQEEKRTKDVALLIDLVQSGRINTLTQLRPEEVTAERVNTVLNETPEHLTKMYGGNTTCLELIVPDNERKIVFDTGTGGIELGKAATRESFATKKPVLGKVKDQAASSITKPIIVTKTNCVVKNFIIDQAFISKL